MSENRLYIHCRECAAELKNNKTSISPKDYAKLEISVSRKGDKNIIYIDCIRHGKQVASFTLEKLLFTKTSCEHCGTDVKEETEKRTIH